MDSSFGAAIADTTAKALLALIVVVAVASAAITYTTCFIFTPSSGDLERQAERQAIVEKLTPREREILGVP